MNDVIIKFSIAYVSLCSDTNMNEVISTENCVEMASFMFLSQHGYTKAIPICFVKKQLSYERKKKNYSVNTSSVSPYSNTE